MKKVFIFLGPPGCGKGTQTDFLAGALKIPHIDTGFLLRYNINNKTPLGVEAKLYIDKGQLVPVHVVESVISERLKNDDCENGYILDGFPRSLEQAYSLNRILSKCKRQFSKDNMIAIYFDIPNTTLVERLVNRRSCPICGKIYNIISSPPKVKNMCDVCDVELIHRDDDTEKTALLRFETYEKQTKPLLEYYIEEGILVQIDANRPIENVWEELQKVVGLEEAAGI